jgi:serine/threonine-protein kinase
VEGLCPACLLSVVLEKEDDCAAVSAEPADLVPGTMLGRYRIERVLGKGGMATVYEACETQPARRIALKVLPREFLHDETFARRFTREAQLAADVEHRNIVPIYASGIDAGIPWMSMRLLQGGTLADVVAQNPDGLGGARPVRMLRGVAEALHYAHSRGVIHRDIKPSNILLDREGGAYISDFGLAQLREGAEKLTYSRMVLGTPHYMSPEQGRGLPVDHRSDIYSLAVVAYELMTGRTPFRGSPVGLVQQHQTDPVPMPDRDVMSEAQFAVLEKALAKDPAQRWQTAVEFVTELESATIGPPTPDRKRPARVVVRWAAVTTGLSVALFLLWSAVSMPQQDQTATPTIDLKEPPSEPERPAPAPAPPPVALVDDPQVPAPGPADVVSRPRKKTTVRPSSEPVAATGARGNSSPPAVEVGPSPPTPPSESDPPQIDVQPPPAVIPSPPVVQPQPKEPPTDVIKEPKRIRTVEPVYPPNAKAAKIEGSVLVQAVILPDGRVTEVRVLNSPNPALNNAAVRAVQQSTYRPGLRNGTPDTFTIEVTVIFRLE